MKQTRKNVDHLRFNPIVSFFSIILIWIFVAVCIVYKENVPFTVWKAAIGQKLVLLSSSQNVRPDEVRLSKTLTLNEVCGFLIFMMVVFSQRNKKLNTVKTQNQRAHSKTSFQSVFFIWNSIDQYYAYCESLDNVPKTFKELSFQIKENTVA